MKLVIIAIATWLIAMVGEGWADDYTARSVSASEAQAHWAHVSVWVSAASVVLSSIALLGLAGSLLQTRNTLRETRDLGRRQARAYVEASDIDFSVDDKGDLVVVCHNSGETPSPMVAVGVEAVRVSMQEMYHVLRNNRPPSPPRKTWTSVGAGKPLFAKVTPLRGSSYIEEFQDQQFGLNDRLLVVGTIIYQDIFDEYFTTEFAFFSHSQLKGFLRPNGMMAAYKSISKEEVERAFGEKI
ncbi:hypothetical protein [Rhizobium sp. No.120]